MAQSNDSMVTLMAGGDIGPITGPTEKFAKALISRKGIERVSFIPAFITPQAQPYAVGPDDPKFQEILEFTEWVSDQHPHKFKVEKDEIVVETSPQ